MFDECVGRPVLSKLAEVLSLYLSVGIAFPFRKSVISPSVVSRNASSAIADVLKVGPDELVEPGGLCGLGAEFGGQAGHLVLEQFAVVLDLGSPDVAAR